MKKVLIYLIISILFFIDIDNILAITKENIYNENVEMLATDTSSVIASYLPYNSKGDKIVVKNENGVIKFVIDKSSGGFFDNLLGGSELNVVGLNNYLNEFQSGNVDGYPIWLNLSIDGKTYTLSNEKDKTAKTNYICQQKINSALELGGTEVKDTCEDIVGPELLEFLDNNVITVIRLGIPLILILFTTFDFAKVVFIDDKDGIQKATKRFGKRIVAALLVYLVPAILIFLVKIIGANDIDQCVDYFNNAASETENK